MKMLISYTYLKNGNYLGFADRDVESTSGKITVDLIVEFKRQAKLHHEADDVVVLNVIRLDD